MTEIDSGRTVGVDPKKQPTETKIDDDWVFIAKIQIRDKSKGLVAVPVIDSMTSTTCHYVVVDKDEDSWPGMVSNGYYTLRAKELVPRGKKS